MLAMWVRFWVQLPRSNNASLTSPRLIHIGL
jgi:hypothetical protein